MGQENAYHYLQIEGAIPSALAMDYGIFDVYTSHSHVSCSLDVISGNNII
jgi:hypothetical protein